jgi:hypothetical protein
VVSGTRRINMRASLKGQRDIGLVYLHSHLLTFFAATVFTFTARATTTLAGATPAPLAHVGVAICRLSCIAQVAERGRDFAAVQRAVRLHVRGELVPETVRGDRRLPSRPLAGRGIAHRLAEI